MTRPDRSEASSVRHNNIKEETTGACLFIVGFYKQKLLRELGLVKAAPWIQQFPSSLDRLQRGGKQM